MAMRGQIGEAGGKPVRLRRRPLPIALYMIAIVLVALVPVFGFSAVLLSRSNEAQQAVVQSLTQATTQALANSVERQLSGLVTTLHVLMTDPGLRNGRFETFHARATAAIEGTGGHLLVLDESLQQMISTRVPFGTPLGRSFDDGPARTAMTSGRVAISGVFQGQTAGAFVFNVLDPLPTTEGTARLLVLTQDASTLATAMTSRQFPEGWNVALLDGSGKVVVGPAETPGFTPGAMSPLEVADSGEGSDSAWLPAQIGGEAVMATAWPVQTAGWRILAWAPSHVVNQPLSTAVWSLFAGGMLMAALIAAAIWWLGNRIAGTVGELAADARQLGAGAPIVPRDYPITEIAVVSEALIEASRNRLSAEAEVRFLMRELAHRSKNQMTVMAAMAKQTAKSADNVPDFVQSFEKRIYGLARSTDLLLANGAGGVDLRELVVGQIDPFCPVDEGRVTITGDPVRLNNQSAQILGMAAHELATNAVKYGAFANAAGSLELNWAARDGRLRLSWREYVDAPPRRSERRGFGTVVLENMVGKALGATVDHVIHPNGIEWTFELPLDAIDPAAGPDAVTPPGGGQ